MKITEKLKMIIKIALAMNVKEVVTDKATLLYDAEELTEGVEVFTKVEEELVPAEDGTYTAEDGTIYEVAEGKISAITPKAEEEIVEEQPIETEEVVEVTEPIEEEPVEDKIDVEAAIKELQDKVVALTDAMTEITNTIATLKAELDKIKTEPAAEPIDEEPKAEEPIKASKMSYLKKK